MGRPKKFKLGDIAWDPERNQHAVVVNYRIQQTTSMVRLIPLDYHLRRRGDAYWERVQHVETTGNRSQTGSIKTYLANELLDKQLSRFDENGRGCSCQCCIHEAQNRANFNNKGEWNGQERAAGEDT
jgi:hypothetical protein